MKKIIQVHITKDENYFVAQCFDLPIVTQAKSLDELVINLQEAIDLQLEGESLADYGFSEKPSIFINFELENLIHAKA